MYLVIYLVNKKRYGCIYKYGVCIYIYISMFVNKKMVYRKILYICWM